MTLERVGTPKKVFSQTKPAYEENLVWIETDGSGNIVAQYVGKFDEFIEVENAAGYPIHFDHVGDAEPETRAGGAWLKTTAFSTVTVDTPTTGDNIYEFDIASLEDVFNVTAVTILGKQSTAGGGPVTISGSGTATVDPAGMSTTDHQVVFTGVETTTSDSASLGTLSNGGSGSVSVGGNIDPRGESVTLTGKETTASASASGTSLTSGQGVGYSVGGNLAPTGESVTFTGSGNDEAFNQMDIDGGSGGDTGISLGGTDFNTGEPYNGANMEYNPSKTGKIDSMTRVGGLTSNGYQSGQAFDVWIDTGPVDSDLSDGGTYLGAWDVKNDLSFSFNQEYSVTGGEQYHIQFKAQKTPEADFIIVDGTGFTEEFENYEAGAGYRNAAANIDVNFAGTTDPSVDVDGDGNAEASYSGTLSNGESVTRSVNLVRGSGTADFSASTGRADVSLSWTETTATEDPSVTLGSSTVSYNGILPGGQTTTLSGVNLALGSNSVSVSTDAGSSVGVDASWTQVNATENPSVSISGDTASFAGILTSGETATRAIDFGADSYTATVSVTNDCETEITWTDVFETLDPTISLNGTTSQFTGLVPQGDSVTVDVSKSSLTTGTNTLELVSGGPAGLSFSYDEVDTSSSNLTVRLYYSDGAVWKEVP